MDARDWPCRLELGKGGKRVMNVSTADAVSRDRIDALRKRFRTRCAATEDRFQNWQIRVHRSLSWLERAIDLDPIDQPDGRLLYDWISFNALYGYWDDEAGFPASDMASWRTFLGKLMQMDTAGRIVEQVRQLRDPILNLLEIPYVDMRFWQNLDRPPNIRRRRQDAVAAFVEGRWLSLLEAALTPVYVLRNQLVHGAATRGSELNRSTLAQARQVLEGVLPAIIEVVVEGGCHDDWPSLCYPPVETDGSPAARRPPR